MTEFFTLGVKELWLKYGTGTKQRYLPLHTLAMNLGEMKSKLVMKIHVISGCDLTSKIGSKLAALNKNPEQYLQLFGENEADQELAFKLAEKYLIEILSSSSNCSSFNELRYHMYTEKGKALNELPPTSLEIQMHLKRCCYVICQNMNLLCYEQFILDQSSFGWKIIDGVSLPQKGLVYMPDHYIITCGCKKAVCRGRCKCRIVGNRVLNIAFAKIIATKHSVLDN